MDLHFRRLSRTDFPQLSRWLEQPHVARWWDHETSPEALERDFGQTVDRVDLADLWVVSRDWRDFGFVQWYRLGDNPGYLEELAAIAPASPDALSLDYFIGEPDLLRQGLGVAMLRHSVDQIFHDYPDAPDLLVPVCTGNVASWKLLERAGFTRIAECQLQPDNPIDPTDHFLYRRAR